MSKIANYAVLITLITILASLLLNDKRLMNNLKNNFKDFLLNNKFYWLAVLFTACISYGFTLTNYSVGIDDDVSYYMNIGLLDQGRFSLGHIFRLIFDCYEFIPFWSDFLGIVFLILAGVIWSIFFIRMSHGKLHKYFTIIFSCLFISYPLYAHLFIFTTTICGTALIFLLTGTALILFSSRLSNGKCDQYLIASKSFYIDAATILILSISIGIFEWTAPLFLTGIFSGLLLEYICVDVCEIKPSIKHLLLYSLKIIIIMTLAIILKEALALFYQKINYTVPNNYTSNYMLWKINTFLTDFPVFVLNIFTAFFIDFYKGRDVSIWLSLFNCTIILNILIAVYISFKSKNMVLFFLVLFIIVSAFSLNIITGNAFLELRTYIHLAVPIGFTLMLFTYLVFSLENKSNDPFFGNLFLIIHKVIKITAITAIVLIVLYQTKDLSRSFYFEYLRYEADLRTTYNIIDEIEKKDGSIKKPVVFIGPFSGSANIRFGYVVFDHDRWNIPERMLYPGRIKRFFHQLGYNIQTVTSQSDLNKALDESQNMPSYPKEGSVKIFNNFVLVKFGTPVLSNNCNYDIIEESDFIIKTIKLPRIECNP